MGSRTPDVLLAKQVLYQLSYVPVIVPADLHRRAPDFSANERPLLPENPLATMS